MTPNAALEAPLLHRGFRIRMDLCGFEGERSLVEELKLASVADSTVEERRFKRRVKAPLQDWGLYSP